MATREMSPVKLAAYGSIIAAAVILFVGASIGGSYLLTLHAIHDFAALQAALKTREAGSAVRSAIPTCKALLVMQNASDTPPHLAAGIHQLVLNSKCARMLALVNQHVPYPEIARRLGG